AQLASRHEAIFPCLLKRTDLSASLGVAVAQSPEHLDELLRTRTFAGHPYILQEAMPGNVEYATYCVCKDGRVLWSCSFATDIGAPIAVKRQDNALARQAIATPDPGPSADRGHAAAARFQRAMQCRLQAHRRRPPADL